MKFKLLSLATAISLATVITAQAAQPSAVSPTNCVIVEFDPVLDPDTGNALLHITNDCPTAIEVNNVSLYTYNSSTGITEIDSYDDIVATTVILPGDSRIMSLAVDTEPGNTVEADIQFQVVPYEKRSSNSLTF